MKPIDLKDIIAGLMTVIVIAISMGRYQDLQSLARQQFARSLTAQGWHDAPFFPSYNGKSMRRIRTASKVRPVH